MATPVSAGVVEGDRLFPDGKPGPIVGIGPEVRRLRRERNLTAASVARRPVSVAVSRAPSEVTTSISATCPNNAGEGAYSAARSWVDVSRQWSAGTPCRAAAASIS